MSTTYTGRKPGNTIDYEAFMAPKNKAKAAGVSASSFLDLKAELSRKEEELSKAKASGKVVAAVKRPDKVCESF